MFRQLFQIRSRPFVYHSEGRRPRRWWESTWSPPDGAKRAAVSELTRLSSVQCDPLARRILFDLLTFVICLYTLKICHLMSQMTLEKTVVPINWFKNDAFHWKLISPNFIAKHIFHHLRHYHISSNLAHDAPDADKTTHFVAHPSPLNIFF